MKIIDCEQRSDEWYAARAGVPTASQFHRIVTPKDGLRSKQSVAYMKELLGELLGEQYDKGYVSAAMREGNEREVESRAAAAFAIEHEVREVGFVTTDDGALGCSPDGFVYQSGELIGGIELKNKQIPAHMDVIESNQMPLEHKPQVHGSMVVTGLDQWWFASYNPRYPDPIFLVKVTRDEYTAKVEAALRQFIAEFSDLRERVGV